MLRSSFHLLTRSPFEVLGLLSTATPDEAKAKYKELARQFHPDVPTGDPEKFREIHAAYQLFKAGKAHEAAAEAAASSGKKYRSESGATAQRYYGRHHPKHAGPNMTAEDIRKMKEETARRQAAQGLFANVTPAMAAAGGLVTFILAVFLYQYWSWLRDPYGEDDIRAYGFTDDMDDRKGYGVYGGGGAGKSSGSGAVFGGPSASPLAMPSSSSSSSSRKAADVDEGKEGEESATPAESAAQLKARQDREAAIRRENRMRRYDDLREYYFVNDPDGCAERRFTAQRVLASFIDVAAVPAKCPIVIDLDESVAHNNMAAHDRAMTDVVQRRLDSDVHLEKLDAEAVAVHTVAAIGRIPKLSVARSEWTFIEYKDSNAKKGPAANVSNCLVAIRNNRFKAGEGFAQRIIVSGSEELQPLAVHKKRRADIKAGLVDPSKYKAMGVVPTKAQQMKPDEE